MIRLRNKHTGVQVVVPDTKATRLIADGTYTAVPDAEQPPKDAEPKQATKANSKPGPTSIADALKAAVGPTWDQVGP